MPNPIVAAFAGLAGAVQGTLVALLAANFICNSTQYVHLDSRGVHLADIVIGAVSGAVVGVLLVTAGGHARAFIFSLWARVAFVASGWSFIRLGLQQTSGAAIAALILFGVWLAMLGVFSIAAVAQPSSAGSRAELGRILSRIRSSPNLAHLCYGSAAVAVALMGIYLTGTRELLFERDANGSVSARMLTYRWLGTVLIESKSATGVEGWRDDIGANAVDILATSGPLQVGGDRSFTNSLTAMVDKSLEAFLESNQKDLRLTETTPRWSFRFYLFGSALVLLYGASLDPLVNLPAGPVLGTWGFAAIMGFAALSSMISMTNRFQQEILEAEQLIERAGGSVERTVLRARDTVFSSDGLQIQFTDPGFDDGQLKSILPALELIGVSLDLSGTAVTDSGVAQLKFHEKVLMLDLRDTAVTNELLADLRAANLRYLDVRNTAITGRGLKQLEGDRLPFLYFSDPNFTDLDLEILNGINGLEYAYIGGSRVTADGLELWKEVLPGVELGP